MAWNIDGPDRLKAVAYTRDFSAGSVFAELKEDGGKDFSSNPEYVTYVGRDDWKVYKITIVIEPAEQQSSYDE